MDQYINDDIIPIIAKFSHTKTLIALSRVSKNSNMLVNNILCERINNLPFRLYIEYVIKNNILIHGIWITIGYNNNNYIEKCNICDNGRWKKYKDTHIFNNDKYIFSNSHVKFLIYEGKVEGIIDYIKKGQDMLIMLYINTMRREVNLCNITDDHNNGYFYFEEVKPNILGLDDELNLSFDDNKIFSCVNNGNYPYKCNRLTTYDGYMLD